MMMKTSKDLYEHMVQDMYYAERQIVAALPDMADAASNLDLKEAFESHMKETEIHVERLEEVCDILGLEAKEEQCESMDGLIKEGEQLVEETEKGPVRDAGLIASAQKIEHYEIAAYGTLCAMAKEHGYDDVAKILHKTLDEEKAADSKLNKIAEKDVNEDAVAEAA